MIVSVCLRDLKDLFTRVYAIDPTNPDYDIVNAMELQVSYSYHGDRNIAQGIQEARSSLDIWLAMTIRSLRCPCRISATTSGSNSTSSVTDSRPSVRITTQLSC